MLYLIENCNSLGYIVKTDKHHYGRKIRNTTIAKTLKQGSNFFQIIVLGYLAEFKRIFQFLIFIDTAGINEENLDYIRALSKN